MLSNRQYGFSLGKSTEDAVADILNKIYHELGSGKPSLYKCINLTKTLDAVDHNEFLNTQSKIRIREIVLGLFRTF